MKNKYLILIILMCFFSCKNSTKKELTYEEYHMKLHKKMDKSSIEFQHFEKTLIQLYNQSEIEPQGILFKADSLISATEKEKDPIKSKIKRSLISDLHYLKAEIYYKNGK